MNKHLQIICNSHITLIQPFTCAKLHGLTQCIRLLKSNRWKCGTCLKNKLINLTTQNFVIYDMALNSNYPILMYISYGYFEISEKKILEKKL